MQIGHHDAMSGKRGFGFRKEMNFQELQRNTQPFHRASLEDQVMCIRCHLSNYIVRILVWELSQQPEAHGGEYPFTKGIPESQNSHKEPKKQSEPNLVGEVAGGAGHKLVW